eukprot:COSAG06_NODE_6584_length_2869_cov_1.486282_3_plen_62_part_01
MADFSGQFPTPGAAGPAVTDDALPVRPADDGDGGTAAVAPRAFVCVLGGPGSGKSCQCEAAA